MFLCFLSFYLLCFLFKLGFSKRNSNCSLQFIHVFLKCVDLWIIAVELKHPQVAFALALPGALTNHLLIDPQMLQRACPASPLGGGRFGCCGGAKSDVICDQGRVQLVLCALGSFKFCWPILHLGCIRVGKGLDKDSWPAEDLAEMHGNEICYWVICFSFVGGIVCMIYIGNIWKSWDYTPEN